MSQRQKKKFFRDYLLGVVLLVHCIFFFFGEVKIKINFGFFANGAYMAGVV